MLNTVLKQALSVAKMLTRVFANKVKQGKQSF